MADASLKDAGRLGFPARWIARGARRRLAVLALLACIVTGAFVGWAIGRALVFGVAQSEIDSLVDLFADRTFDHFHDIRTVLVEANDDRLGRCSDDELLALRRTVFETPAIAVSTVESGANVTATLSWVSDFSTRYAIQRSIDLVTWTDVAEIYAGIEGSTVTFQDEASSLNTQFYRAIYR